jgi:hypothetical protein
MNLLPMSLPEHGGIEVLYSGYFLYNPAPCVAAPPIYSP